MYGQNKVMYTKHTITAAIQPIHSLRIRLHWKYMKGEETAEYFFLLDRENSLPGSANTSYEHKL